MSQSTATHIDVNPSVGDPDRNRYRSDEHRPNYRAAEDLLEIVMRRYERASTLLTSNRPVKTGGNCEAMWPQ